jgi:hypothetical protein
MSSRGMQLREGMPLVRSRISSKRGASANTERPLKQPRHFVLNRYQEWLGESSSRSGIASGRLKYRLRLRWRHAVGGHKPTPAAPVLETETI